MRVVDTTGAGDTFVGYICAQWAMGGEASVVERIELATAAAALAVTRPGSASAIPSRSAVAEQSLPGPGRIDRKDDRMKVALGADHAGFPLKGFVRAAIERLGHEVLDCGTDSKEPVDFPDITAATCEPVPKGWTAPSSSAGPGWAP